MNIKTRNEEISYYRECDERIAAAWDKFHDANQEIKVLSARIVEIKKFAGRSYNLNDEKYQIRAALEIEKIEEKLAVLRPAAEYLGTAAMELDKKLYTGWSRFFLVKHIHSSTTCSSFRPTTRIGWLPSVSGLTEVEAVKEHGEALCTICFPSAPVELTTKPVDPAFCAGSGKRHSQKHLTGRESSYAGAAGYCPECLRWNTITKSGLMRKHKVDETRRHALTK